MTPTLRWMAALALGCIAVTAPVTSYFSWRDAHTALLRSREARRFTDFRLCEALNRVYRLNNTDRATLLRAQKGSVVAVTQTRKLVSKLRTPDGKLLGGLLLGLIEGSVKSTALEVARRPHLTVLRCVPLVTRPPPPSVTVPTTTR